MHKTIEFPSAAQTKYYKSHWLWFARAAESAGWLVVMTDMPHRTKQGFVITSNGVRILMDHSDIPTMAADVDEFKLCFKYNWNREHCTDHANVFPWSPVSFYDWFEFEELRRRFDANFESIKQLRTRIANNQRAYAGARERRLMVRAMLIGKFGKRVDVKIHDQKMFWRRARESMVAVHVPGQRNDIFDRGHIQLMAFGVPTISPKLSTVLIDGFSPMPGVNYFECAADYSDLVDVVEYVEATPEHAEHVGASARTMFDQCCAPRALMFYFHRKLLALLEGKK